MAPGTDTDGGSSSNRSNSDNSLGNSSGREPQDERSESRPPQQSWLEWLLMDLDPADAVAAAPALPTPAKRNHILNLGIYLGSAPCTLSAWHGNGVSNGSTVAAPSPVARVHCVGCAAELLASADAGQSFSLGVSHLQAEAHRGTPPLWQKFASRTGTDGKERGT